MRETSTHALDFVAVLSVRVVRDVLGFTDFHDSPSASGRQLSVATERHFRHGDTTGGSEVGCASWGATASRSSDIGICSLAEEKDHEDARVHPLR